MVTHKFKSGPIRWSETWLKLTENTVLAELLWEKNTVLAEKRSRTSRIWGKPNMRVRLHPYQCHSSCFYFNIHDANETLRTISENIMRHRLARICTVGNIYTWNLFDAKYRRPPLVTARADQYISTSAFSTQAGYSSAMKGTSCNEDH